MCRVLQYLGPPLVLDDLLFAPSSSLARQCHHPQLTQLLNLGGFGLAAWDPSSQLPAEPWLYRSTTLPAFDANLRSLARKISATCALAHIRGVPFADAEAFGPHNLHPFRYPDYAWAMAHNGFLKGFTSMRHALTVHTSGEVARWVKGTTDSEAVYALVMSRLADPTKAGVDELATAVQESLRILRQVRRAHGLDISSSLNLFFTNGTDALSLRFAFDFGCYDTSDPSGLDPAATSFLSLWYTVGQRFGEVDGQWRMTGDQTSAEALLVASEPLSLDRSGWTEVPEYTMLLVERRGASLLVRTVPVDV
ncbi:MAG: glutamine amidotransferase [Myxococcota bacterium]|jgi:glutamine amidotransferase